MMNHDKAQCCGCFACVSRCPQNAIKIEEDAVTGFRYPHIDAALCVNCGLCEKICDFEKEKNTESNIISAFGLQYKNKDVLKNSTSGGAFTAFSDIILNDHGAVAGAVMEDFHIFHKIAETPEERDAMRGSKYVQSDMSGIYEKMEKRLKSGQKVLFTGTPCQTAAIKSYFGDKYKGQLFLIDFLCHGVPSEKLFQDHISYISQKNGKHCLDYKFRSKDYGWRSQVMEGAVLDKDEKPKYSAYMQRLYHLFNSGASLRPSCHQCKYRTYYRYSDITIADFWGIDKVAPNKNNGLGHSLVLINSDEGVHLLNELKASDTAELFSVPVADILFRIPLKPTPNINDSDVFWNTYAEKGYQAVLDQYSAMSAKNTIKFEIKKLLRKKG